MIRDLHDLKLNKRYWVVVCIQGTTPHWSTRDTAESPRGICFIRYFSSAVPSQLPKSYCSAVCCNSPCSSCCSNVNALFPALELLQVYGSFLPLLDYDSSIWEMPNETSSACVCHPTSTPKKATTPALCIQWTLNEHLLIEDIAKY